MNIVIRTDASIEIGTGHVMRCLTLAKQLERNDVQVTFICRELKGNSITYLEGQGMTVSILPFVENIRDVEWTRENWQRDASETLNLVNNMNTKVDMLIVDHYALDSKWERMLRSSVIRIMVIDDLADRAHNCDLLLDQNYYLNKDKRYHGLLPENCIQLLGPNYVLLRDEFLQVAETPRVRNGKVENILVFFGGSDPTGETIKTLKAIKELNLQSIEINVVVGASNPNKELVEELCLQIKNCNFFCQVSNMAELMNQADLSIGAGGATTWERCFLGLPSIVIVIAENQRIAAKELAKLGLIINLGVYKQVTITDIKKNLLCMLNNAYKLEDIKMKCKEVLKRTQNNFYSTADEIQEY